MLPSDEDSSTFAIVLAGSAVALSIAIAARCLGACQGWGSSRVEGPKVKCDAPPRVVRVDAIAPDWGMAAGGAPVTITGVGFDPGVSVFINGTVAGNVVRVSDTTVTADAPPGLAGGPYAVRAVNADGTEDTHAALFTYRAPATLTSVRANGVNRGAARGTTDGNTPVILTGTHFRGVPTVRFDGRNAINVVRVSDTQLTADTPAHIAAQVDVEVINPGEPGVTLANAYLYTLPAPMRITPAEGGLGGGQPVTIDGECFGNPVRVSINGRPATHVVRVSEERITADTPAMDAGGASRRLGVSVTNTSSNQSGTLLAAFLYHRLTVTDIQPPFGSYAGNTPVTLTGTGFSPRTRVRFGGIDAAVVCDRHDRLTATTGALPSPGDLTVDVQVDEGADSVTLVDAFAYLGRALAGAMYPAEAIHEGGTQATLFGVGFAHDTTVYVGAREAAAAFVSLNELRVTIPARVAPAAPAARLEVAVKRPEEERRAIAGAFTYQALRPARNVVVYPAAANSFDHFAAAAGNTVTVRTLLGELHNQGETAAEHVGLAQPVGGLFHAHINGNAEGVLWTRVQDGPDRINQLIDLSNGRVGNNYNNRWIHTDNGEWFPASKLDKKDRVKDILGTYAVAADDPRVTAAQNGTFRLAGLSPATGPLNGGWNVTITAENVPDGPVPGVRFGAVNGVNVVRVDATTLTVDVPAGAALGAVNVRVTDMARGIYAELPGAFRYEPLAVTEITPSLGDHAGNQFVVIRGTGFEVGAAVAFAGTPAANVVVRSPTCITAETPARAAGNVMVTVTNPGAPPRRRFRFSTSSDRWRRINPACATGCHEPGPPGTPRHRRRDGTGVECSVELRLP
ncbi:IPT/TIG domain-containing protein [Pyxidicoccus sp. 3LG]